MTDTTTVYFYTWGFWAYPFVVLGFAVAIARVAYNRGRARGYKQGVYDEQNRAIEPTEFRQRTAEADPRRRATVRTARMIARRQPKPEPRRGRS